MKVYIVIQCHHDIDSVDGVFLSKELAQNHIEKRYIQKKKYIDYYEWYIQEHKVIAE